VSKIIAVVGATGAQGGGLARAILDDPRNGFSVRALTRHVDSEKARVLEARGAEIVFADVDDEESVVRAFTGAYGAYCVTNFWEHFSAEREVQQAAHMARAAKRAGLQHIIWSTLEDTRKFVPLDDNRMPTLKGKYKVPHFDGKGEADRIFQQEGVPTTFLMAAFYWDNMIHFGSGPVKGSDGNYAITFPMDDKPMAGIAVEDIGRCAYGVFRRGSELIGKTIGIAGEHLTGSQMAAALSDALKIEIRYNAISPEAYRALGFPGADDLGNMFQFYRDFADYFQRGRDVDLSRSLNPRLQDFRTWLAGNASQIPL
jgi:uncharacterized protein YbjT (DUF2867 family)